MKKSSPTIVVALAVFGLAAAAAADGPARSRATVSRLATRIVAAPKATAATYSVEVPYVQSYTPPDGGQSGTLTLDGGQFDVSLVATDQHHNNVQGAGVALPQTDVLGYFSLPTITNNPSNPEVFIKIVAAPGGGYWVFYGHLTDLIYDLTVTEVATQITRTYHKDAGNAPGGFDTSSFVHAVTTPAPRAASAPRAAQVLTPNASLRTSVDISNNTTTTANAIVQYCYATTGGGFQGCSPQRSIALPAYSNFHQDDFVAYLGSVGDVTQSVVDDSFGTLLVTFQNLPSQQGWEGTVSANVYNRVSEVDPLRGTVGCGEQISYFFESATSSLVGTARDTVPAPSAEAGSISSTLGVHNTDANGTGAAVNAVVTLYDPATGQPVGNQVPLSNIQPGELRLTDDLFGAAGVPGNVTTAIVFVDVSNPASTTIEGFILDQDTDSLDTRFHEMKCAAGCF